MSGEAVEFPARDGYRLAGTLYRPHAPNGRAVLFNGAVGVRQQFYGAFAAYLAERGFTALTFDYRGIGASRREPVRRCRARIRDWMELDATAALETLAGAAPDARLFVVAHSFGGNGLGLVHGIERISGAIFVGVQSGYWRHWSGLGRAGMWFLTHLLLPGMARLFGYVPASVFGQGEDLPGGVAREWASWCRHPRYAPGVTGAPGYRGLAAPIRSYWITDDGYAPRAATEAILREYSSSSSEIVVVDPAAHGGGRIGHFGFFRERFRGTLWEDAAAWLAAAGRSSRGRG